MARIDLAALLVATLTSASNPALALTSCEMRFDLEGWSAFYKTAAGEGVVDCDDGHRARVVLESRAGGLTFGRSSIIDGIGHFSLVHDVGEIFGDYASAEAHAGLGASSNVQVVTKGPV